MRWIWGLLRGILVLTRIMLVAVAYAAGAGGLYGLLFMFFFAVGLVLVLFGFDLDAVDRWLDAHADWFEWIGTILFKSVLAMILIGCVYVVGKGIYDRLPLPGRPRGQKKRRAPRTHGKRRAASAMSGQNMARAKGSPRLSESGEELPGAEGGESPRLGGEEGGKPMGCAAVIVAIVVGYFCYIGLTMNN